MIPRHPLTLFPILVLLVLVGAMLPTVLAQPGSDKIEPLLRDRLAAEGRADFLVTFSEQADLSPAHAMSWAGRGEFVYNVLQETAARAQAEAIAYLDAHGFKHQTFIAGNELYVWAGDLAAAEALAGRPGVGSVRAPRTYFIDPLLAAAPPSPEALSWGLIDAKADQFWSTFGVQGDGIVVAGIDTGVQWNHPALDQAFKCGANASNPACWADPSNICGGTACDNNGHGTHTMGTMVADDDPSLTWQAGMAPNAQWIACKGCESSSCSEYALNTCADWILAPAGSTANRPHVVNNSWGGGGCDTWYLAKVNAWRAAGIFPAFSAGNAGSECSTMGSPGDYQESFATAAHDSSRNAASFSSRGPSCFGHDPYTKPNISAPGVSVCSTVPTNAWSCGYSGTSMASPHTAGAVALLWSCNPGMIGQLGPTFEVLQDTANTPPAGNCGAPPDGEGNYTYGYGYLDMLAAGQSACINGEGLWTIGPSMCFDLTRFDAGYDPATGLVYVLGGRSGTATVGDIYAYNPATGACADTGADMPTPISNYSVNRVNDGSYDLLCTFGGRAADGTTTLDVQCYNPLTNAAAVVTQLPGAFDGYAPGAQAVVANEVFVFGGFRSTGAPYELNLTYSYYPATHSFVLEGSLSLARAYLFAGVVGNAVYAFGGTIFDGTSLVAQTRAEVLQQYYGSWYWYDGAVADLPVASAEGRAFSFVEYIYPGYAGKIVLAGGGQWPNETAEALVYDAVTDSYDYGFPNLNVSRRNHAGVLVPSCTSDPADGQPALWVLGGRCSAAGCGGDSPPYAPAEYLPLSCVQPVPSCQLFPGRTLALPEQTGTGRGHWSSTDLQPLSLALDTQPLTASFLAPSGELVDTLDFTLPGGGTGVYIPANLPPYFAGTLLLETPGRAAMAVVHLEDPPEEGGNAVFPGVADEMVGQQAYTPVDGCTALHIHNLDRSAAANVEVFLYDLLGNPVDVLTNQLPPLGTWSVDLRALPSLPPGFAGGAVVAADQLVQVTTQEQCGGYAAFGAPAYCDYEFYAPYVPGSLYGQVETTVAVQNPSSEEVQATLYYSATGLTTETTVLPWSTYIFPHDYGEAEALYITGDSPLIATIQTVSSVPGDAGVAGYRPTAVSEATRAVALPVLFSGDHGWETGDRIWVMNIGTAATRVKIRFANNFDHSLAWVEQEVSPGGVWQVPLPAMPGTRAAAIALADPDQPIIAVAGAGNPNPDLRDSQILYAGTNFSWPHVPVSGADFTALVNINVVTFDGSAAGGTSPIYYTWDFGDGTTGMGQHVAHMYSAGGTYTVVMTATNNLGFYSVTTSQPVTVAEGVVYDIYLPVVTKGF